MAIVSSVIHKGNIVFANDNNTIESYNIASGEYKYSDGSGNSSSNIFDDGNIAFSQPTKLFSDGRILIVGGSQGEVSSFLVDQWKYYNEVETQPFINNDGTALNNRPIIKILEYEDTIVFIANGTNDAFYIASYDGDNWKNYDGTGDGTGIYINGSLWDNVLIDPENPLPTYYTDTPLKDAIVYNNQLVLLGTTNRVASYDGTNWKNYDGTGDGKGVFGEVPFNVDKLAVYDGMLLFIGVDNGIEKIASYYKGKWKYSDGTGDGNGIFYEGNLLSGDSKITSVISNKFNNLLLIGDTGNIASYYRGNFIPHDGSSNDEGFFSDNSYAASPDIIDSFIYNNRFYLIDSSTTNYFYEYTDTEAKFNIFNKRIKLQESDITNALGGLQINAIIKFIDISTFTWGLYSDPLSDSSPYNDGSSTENNTINQAFLHNNSVVFIADNEKISSYDGNGWRFSDGSGIGSGISKNEYYNFPAVFTFKTNNAGTSESNQVQLPLDSNGTYNFRVNWGDGTEDFITSYNQAETTHTYSTVGTYNIQLAGTVDGFGFDSIGLQDNEKLIDVKQWVNLKLHNNGYQFYNCSNLSKFSSADNPDLTGITNFNSFLENATSFNHNFNGWDFSNITNMENMLDNTVINLFNYKSILSWFNSQTVQSNIIFGALGITYNSEVETYRTSLINNYNWSFIGDKTISEILAEIEAELTDLNIADVLDDYRYDDWSDEVIYEDAVFYLDLVEGLILETDFISVWDTRETTNSLTGANQIQLPLDSSGTYNFTVDWGDGTQDVITAFDQEEVVHTYEIEGKYTIKIQGVCDGFGFNNINIQDRNKLLDIKQWGTLTVHNNGYQFYNCSNLIKVSLTEVLDLSNNTNLEGMFSGATSLNEYFGDYDISTITNMSSMLDNTALNVLNYSDTLIAWEAADNTPSNITLGANGLLYNAEAETARTNLINTYNWIISGDSL